jgi:hypothetical protein
LAYQTASTGLIKIPKGTTVIPTTEIFSYNYEINEFSVLEDYQI